MRLRVVNKSVVDFFLEHYEHTSKPLALIYEAPTGYGKTSIAPIIGRNLRRLGYAYGYVHVLPMRSIVRDLYKKLYDLKPPFNYLSDDIKNKDEDIGYQASGLFLSGKNPFLSRIYNVTTIDSFILNLIRVGLGEENKLSRHFEVSRAMIFSSLNVFDEAHLYGGDPGAPEPLLYTSTIVSMRTIASSLAPLIVLTATLPEKLGYNIYTDIKYIMESLGGTVVWVKYGVGAKSSDNSFDVSNKIICTDKEFDQLVESVKWSTVLYAYEDDYIKKLVDECHSQKVLIVTNKPSRAVKYCKILTNKGFKPILIHGRLKYRDREKSEKDIEKGADVVVSTQVIEAGIDRSFDILYTDIAPPSNLVQRVGRINRYFENSHAYVNIYLGGYENVYSKEIVSSTISTLKKLAKSINWRKPSDYNNNYGYRRLLDEVYKDYEPRVDAEELIRHIVLCTSIHIGIHDPLKQMYRSCIKNKGVVRESILIPIIPVEKEVIENMDIDEIAKESVPVSMQWFLRNRDKLLDKNTIYIVKLVDYNTVNVFKKELSDIKLKELLCRELVFPRDGVFIGLLAKPEVYINGLGLLV